MSAERLLASARAFVERGWSQGAPAVDGENRPVPVSAPEAVRWSARGAVEAAWDAAGAPDESVRDRALLALASVVGDIDAWNDAPERSVTDVVAAFDDAATLL